MLHLRQGIPLSNNEEPTIDAYNLNESPENDAECKKPIPKGHIWYDSTYITFSKLKNKTKHCWDGGQINGCQDLGMMG